jgi:voltage-gated potassium channel Kch
MDRHASTPGLRERLSYRFDRFMERGTVALILGLGVVSVVLIVVIVVVLVIVRGDEGIPIPQLLWMSLMRTLDAGTMGGDDGTPQFMFGMLAVTLTGIFIISTLIGILSNGIGDKLAELRKGRSRVLERDHVLILGWSQQVFPVITELIEAGVSRRRTTIVVLADRDRVEMEDAIHERVVVPRRVRIVCRSGRPTSLADLRIGNPDEARAIVVLQSEGDDPDVNVLKAILALTGRADRRPEPYRIVAEVKDHASAGIAKLIAGAEVHLLLADELVSRIVAQTCRQVGLSAVYLELLDFAGHELHVAHVPALAGRTFGEAVARITGAIPAGIVRSGIAELCPPPDRVIGPDDRLVLLAEDHGSEQVADAPAPVDSDAIVPPSGLAAAPERTLVLGWNRRAAGVVRELDAYAAPGSEVVAVSGLDRVLPESGEITGLVNLTLTARLANTTSRPVLYGLDIPSFDHVIVLCEADDRDPDIADARILLTLLHLRDIGSAAGRRFSIVSEMLDERNRELAEVARADDFIVSSRVLSLLLAQIAETPDLADVFRDLFDADGAEIYLRDAAAYVKPGRDVSFATVQAAAQGRGELALGYRLASRTSDAAAAYGVVLNPARDARVTFDAGDRIVVLADA